MFVCATTCNGILFRPRESSAFRLGTYKYIRYTKYINLNLLNSVLMTISGFSNDLSGLNLHIQNHFTFNILHS